MNAEQRRDRSGSKGSTDLEVHRTDCGKELGLAPCGVISIVAQSAGDIQRGNQLSTDTLKALHRPSEANQTDAAIVIQVHGTFAGDAEHSGDKWWQCNSRAANLLQSKLPRGVAIAQGKDVFHWSGENSERARNKAALDLLDHVQVHEEAGRDYHLVGHSHGGSVIWNALRLATCQRRELNHLKSWTTVGTPYLQHRGRSAWDVTNLFNMIAGILLLPMAFRALRGLTSMVTNALTGNNVAMTLQHDKEVGYIAILRAPILSALKWIGVAITDTPEGLVVGSYDPSGGQSLFQYFFMTSEGLLLIGTLMIVAYFFLHLSVMCIRPVIESYRIRAEERLQIRTFQEYGFRSLSLWSPDDEAINGLRATLSITVSFVRKMMPHERVFLADAISLVSRPYFWVFSPIFNRYVQPRLDRVVRTMVIRSAQGNDRPTATIIDVTPSPVRELLESVPPIPEKLNARILAVADHHSRDVAPLLRQLIGSASIASGLEDFCEQLSGRELVHTSYFDHPEILDLIACNITLETDVDQMQMHLGRMSPYLVEWFADAKSRLQHEASPEIVAARHMPIRRAA